MGFTVAELAKALGAVAVGDTSLIVQRAAEPADAGPDDLALAMNPKYAEALGHGQARVAMLWPDADWQALGLKAALLPDRPRFAMSGLTRMMDSGQGGMIWASTPLPSLIRMWFWPRMCLWGRWPSFPKGRALARGL